MTHNLHAPYLFVTDQGRVFHCTCCGRVQVEFAVLTLLLDRSYFEKLERQLAEAVLDDSEGGRFWLKATTDAGTLRVPLQREDVEKFRRLLSGARAMLRLQDQLRATEAGQHHGSLPSAEGA